MRRAKHKGSVSGQMSNGLQVVEPGHKPRLSLSVCAPTIVPAVQAFARITDKEVLER